MAAVERKFDELKVSLRSSIEDILTRLNDGLRKDQYGCNYLVAQVDTFLTLLERGSTLSNISSGSCVKSSVSTSSIGNRRRTYSSASVYL